MLQYMLFVALLLQCSPLNRCDSPRNRIGIKHRYSPGHIKLHSPHQHLVSPINLLNPDKYEYFTINNQGNIIKRLMTSKEIQSIVAGNNIKQNVFDRLESPQGIITNIVSSIKNVLNTELLSKHQENQNSDNNVNTNMADVTTYESPDKEPEYVPAVLSFEISSPDEDVDNATELKQNELMSCPNCGVKPSIAPESTTQLKSTEATTKSTLHHQEERVTETTSTKKTTENMPQLSDIKTTEKVSAFIASNKTTIPYVDVTEITPTELDKSSTNTMIESVTENIPILLEEDIKQVGKITTFTDITPENAPILLTEEIVASTEKSTDNTPMLLEEFTKLVNHPTHATEKITDVTQQLLDENVTETATRLADPTEKVIESITHQTEESTTQFSTTHLTDENLLMSFILNNNLSDQKESTVETTESAHVSTLHQTTDELSMSFIMNKNLSDLSEKLQSDKQYADRIITFTLPSTNTFETTTRQGDFKSTESAHVSTLHQTTDELSMSFMMNKNLSDSSEKLQSDEQYADRIITFTLPSTNTFETTTTQGDFKSTESAQVSTLHQTADEPSMSFIPNKYPSQLSDALYEDEQYSDRIITFTLPSNNKFETTTSQGEESVTQSAQHTNLFTLEDELREPHYTTKTDYQTKPDLYTDLFDKTIETDSTTEHNTYDVKTTVDSQSHIDGFSTLAETTNKPEVTTLSAPQTADEKIQNQPDEPTNLTVDTQNAFYMILELLKDDNMNDESSVQQYTQENAVTDSNETPAEEYEDADAEEEAAHYSTELFDSTTAHAFTDVILESNELTTEAPFSNLPELFDTTVVTEKYTTTNLFNIVNKVKPTNKVTISWKPTTIETTPPKTTFTTRLTSTAKPTTSTTASTSTTFKLKSTPYKAKPSPSPISQQPSSNEFVSIAEMILRQANPAPAPHANSAENVDVENLLDLLAVTSKNMTSYVGETATVASILKPLKKPQPVQSSPIAEHDVLQSFLTITNELKQDIQSASTEDAGNRITNDLFQKLGESEARRNTSFSDQLNANDIILTDESAEFPEGSDENSDEENSEMNNFFKLCNRIGIDMYQSITTQREFEQTKSFSFSPFSAISMMSMLHLGARGKTADQINKLIGLDEMTSFNPHVTFRTISQSIEEENSNSYFVRMLFSDENLGKLQNFFKTKVTQLYSGYAEEILFDDKNMITNRVNLLVNNSTQGAQPQFLEDFHIRAAPPLCLISANSFELGCPANDERPDIFFHVIDAKGKRKLINLPAHVYTGSFLFGYNTEMDITVASIFSEAREISTVFLMPGQQSGTIERNSLLDLESKIFTNTFPTKLETLEAKLRPQISSVLHIPHLNQQSFVNVSRQLQQLGLGELFRSDSSNLRGIQETTAAPIHMSEFLQINRVSLCDTSIKQKSSEITSPFLNVKSNVKKHYQNTQSNHAANVIKLDKPFLYIIRHNPSQLILYVGRFNPVE